ncbi:MAG: hypothetical protein KA712_24695 [Myxococcales bacterium]|nr:hypothetical protein [Myxococcales bacterium]
MAFNRATSPEPTPSPDELTARMVAIGMNFAGKAAADADIERTLLHASALGMDDGDLRVLAVLTTWLGVHHGHVNADQLVRLVGAHRSGRVRAYWAAIATWLRKDRRLARLAAAYEGPVIDLLPTGTEFQISRRGADERLSGSSRGRALAGESPGELNTPRASVVASRGNQRHSFAMHRDVNREPKHHVFPRQKTLDKECPVN